MREDKIKIKCLIENKIKNYLKSVIKTQYTIYIYIWMWKKIPLYLFSYISLYLYYSTYHS